ncbi:TPR-like protein [Morchella conica CCBAS932]|uniref:TPR-like protein n=1 Tax=Morchella conica CCBAS932 TaxID=1392247 RepID=A0A3N4KT09_9PEZI|nr:TPR-like protein [Morchella conica CCBAS932]
MEEFLKSWRQDALNKHQYDAAIFIGDKLLALTGDPKDAFWLAQVHFSTGHYNRAQSFLTRNDLITRSTSCRYLAALCLIKQSKYDEALNVLGDKNPTHLASGSSTSTASRRRAPSKSSKDRDDPGSNIKFEAAMCYLRGLVYAKQNAFDKAKECYKLAVLIDVKCFEAFDQLMKNSLMSPDEEWSFLESLDFEGINSDGEEPGQQAEFVKMLYTTRLSKYKNPMSFNNATETLAERYNLRQNADLILSRAELLFTQCRFKECLSLCENVIEDDNYNFAVYPLYLACLHELNMKNKLFLISHDMADNYPEEPVTWLAVGVYYLTTGKIAEARRFFSKASMMDPHFGPAWIGFAHTFAAEGEHDQAISAYSTAARLFQGTHLPQLFLGMQHLQLNNITLADEYLNNAFILCKSDPLLLNELGVVFYHKEHLKESIQLFTKALEIADEIESDPKAWIATRANLGHAYRRLELFDKALEAFEEVTRAGEGRDANIYSAVGLCQLQLGRPWDAVVSLHEALAISPQDPIATELLEKALKENANTDALFQATLLADGEIVVQDEEDVDFILHERMLRSKLKAKAIAASGGHRYGGDGGESSTRSSRRGGTASGERRRLGDVTSNYQEVGGESMDLSDEEL